MSKTDEPTLSPNSWSCVEMSHATCRRCGGLMVNEVCIDLLNNTSELDCSARRCVQCGDIVDAVIVQNRQLNQPPLTTYSPVTGGRSLERSVPL